MSNFKNNVKTYVGGGVAHKCKYPWRPEEGISGAGVTGGYEPSERDAGIHLGPL